MKKTFLRLSIAAMVVSLAACGSHQNSDIAGTIPQETAQPVQNATAVAAPAPVVQAAPQQSNGMGNMLVGGVAGYLLGSTMASSRSADHPRSTSQQVINRTVIVREAPTPSYRAPTPTYKPPAPKTAYASSFSAARPSTSKPTSSYGGSYGRSSSFGSSRSYSSSYSYRSSFSSGRR